MSAPADKDSQEPTSNSSRVKFDAPLSSSVLGQQFGRYEALLRLASGGMGHVLVGRVQSAHGVQRLVAIKTILAHLIDNELYLKLFIREAEIASRLHHPNVVPVLELGRTETEHFLVMEYFPSMPLHTVLRESLRKRTPMHSDVACAIVADAAAGLHAAHELCDENGTSVNLVHRDATPSNLLVGVDGSVKLTDFGVAKATGAQFENMTVGGDLRGKLGYLSPEQITGVGVDRRADVFTLGIVLWEVLAGRRLFKFDNELALLRAITEEDAPTIKDYVRDLPNGIVEIVARALNRDRDKRFQSAAEMRQALTAQLKSDTEVSRSIFARDTIGELLADRQRQISSATAELDSAASVARRKTPSPKSELPGPLVPDALSAPAVSRITHVAPKRTRLDALRLAFVLVGLFALGGAGVVATRALSPSPHQGPQSNPNERTLPPATSLLSGSDPPPRTQNSAIVAAGVTDPARQAALLASPDPLVPDSGIAAHALNARLLRRPTTTQSTSTSGARTPATSTATPQANTPTATTTTPNNRIEM